jgi:hypothetical protein
MRRRGWSKRVIFAAALPIPAAALAYGFYLFATVERLANGEPASVREEYRLTGAIIFATAAVVLYLIGLGVAWLAGGEPNIRSEHDALNDVFE